MKSDGSAARGRRVWVAAFLLCAVIIGRADALADVTAAAPNAAAAPPAQSSLHALFEGYWQDRLRLQPSLALQQGDARYHDEFDDSLRDDWRAAMIAMLDGYQRQLAGVSLESLSDGDRLSCEILRYQLDLGLRFYGSRRFELQRMLPIDPFQGAHLEFAADASGTGDYPFATVADYESALIRADRYARWTDDAIQRLREGVRANVTLPRLLVARLLPQLRVHLGKAPRNTEFWRPLETLPANMSPAEKQRLRHAFEAKISDVIQPAYARLASYLQHDYLPRARATVGLGALPAGADLYAYDVEYHTTTTLTPAAIHAIGLAEVRQIEHEFEVLETAVGFHGTLAQFYASVRGDPRQHFTDPAAIVPAFEADRQRIAPLLPRLFATLPTAPYEIRAMPESARASGGNGNYAPAAADGSRPGILWINTYASGVQDTFNVMTLSLHEGLPGHHLQTSLAQEQRGLPSFRRFDATNAYGEGWALYAESLGRELGVFDDPWQYYGHLNYAMMRAARLVVDTGLHRYGWSVARGIRFMVQHSSMTPAQARAEVERYAAYPGQALSYKMGELRIRALRHRAELAAGAGFDVRAFHDQVLLGGSMPLGILEQKLDRWIAAGRQPP